MKRITKNDVEIDVIAEFDHIPVRGNAIYSGDDAFDRKVEDEIISRINNGDVWAWASVEVKVTWETFEASDYSGCCMYDDENDFIQNSGYYDDMVEFALDDLNRQIEDNWDLLNSLKD